MYAQSLGRHPRKLAAVLIVLVSLLAIGCPGFGSEEAGGDFSDLPENPTWEDISPLMEAYCNDCHSVPPEQGAPGGFRYDVCEDSGDELGASSYAQRMAVRTVEQIPSPMPPATYSPQPTPEDVELIRRWVDNGAPCTGGGQ